MVEKIIVGRDKPDLAKYGDDCKRVALQVTVNGEWKRSARLTGAVA